MATNWDANIIARSIKAIHVEDCLKLFAIDLLPNAVMESLRLDRVAMMGTRIVEMGAVNIAALKATTNARENSVRSQSAIKRQR